MDFQQLADVAEKWCSSTPFELIAAEESERRMDFYADPGVSFYVLCPDNGCGDSFVSTRERRAPLRPSPSSEAGWGGVTEAGRPEPRSRPPGPPCAGRGARSIPRESLCGIHRAGRMAPASRSKVQSGEVSFPLAVSETTLKPPRPRLRVSRKDTKPLSTPAVLDLLNPVCRITP